MARTVFVDVTPLAERHLTGIGRYTARLALALGNLEDCVTRFTAQDDEVLAPSRLSWDPDQDLARWGRRVWRGRRVPLRQATWPADCLAVYPCLRPSTRRFPFEVSVLHDFTPLLLPWTHAPRTVAQFQAFFGRGLLLSDAALADSRATKADARWLCDFPQDRVTVAPLGPSLCVGRHLHAKPVERRPEVGLVVSTLEPRKNAFFLLDWFRSTAALPPGSELWWVGSVGWLTSMRKLRPYARPGAQGRRVRFLGNVSDASLCRLHQTAGWSVYPSLYEGFGLPVLDALRHGAPVLSARHSSLAELDHPGVHFFDPCDPATLDGAYLSMARSGHEVISQSMLDARYSWTSLAKILIGLDSRGDRMTAGRDMRAA